MYEQMDIFDFIKNPNPPVQAEIPPKTQFEQLFEKVRDPVFPCANCLCEYCANNVEQTTDKVKTGEMREPCFNCDECHEFTGDRRHRRMLKEHCDKFVLSDYGAARNRKHIKLIETGGWRNDQGRGNKEK